MGTMADTKLGMSLDDIIQTNTKTNRKAVRRGGRPPKRGAAEAVNADSAAPKARGGVRKAGASRNPRIAPEEPQQSGRTLRPRRKRRGCDLLHPPVQLTTVLRSRVRTFMRSVHQSAWSAGGQTSRVPFKAHIRRGDAAPRLPTLQGRNRRGRRLD